MSSADFKSQISQDPTAAKGIHFLDLRSGLQPNYPGYKFDFCQTASHLQEVCAPSSLGACSNGLGENKSLHGLKARETGRRNPHNANLPDSSNPVM